MKYCIVYLSSPQESKLTTGEYRYDMLCCSIKNTTKVFNDVPYIIFHEDLDDEHKNNILKINENAIFEKLDFIREELDFKKFGRPKGYMLMCRFFSGEMQEYLIDHNYDSYIRFDDDSFLLEPIINKDELINDLTKNDYIFRTIFFDGQKKYNNGIPMQSLYNFTLEYIKDKGYDVTKIYNFLYKNKIIDNNGLYTGIAPYNNFHATNLKLWKNPLIKDYINKILECNGCLMNFWMDANIHSMIIFILCPLVNIPISIKTNFGYRHNRHFSILNNFNFIYKENEDFFMKN